MPHSLRSSGLSIFAISRFDSNSLARCKFPSRSPGLIVHRTVIAPHVRISNLVVNCLPA